MSALDDDARTVWIVDSHRDGKRLVARADEKLTGLVELEAGTRACGKYVEQSKLRSAISVGPGMTTNTRIDIDTTPAEASVWAPR
jgi:hypothetical protein